MHENFARGFAAPGSAGNLREQLKRALARAEIGKMQRQVGVDDPDKRDVREMQTLRDHLRADKNVDFAGAKVSQRFAIRILARHRVGIHPPNDCLREDLRDVGLHFFRAETGIDERVLAARRTFFWNGRRVAAQMATQPRNSCDEM